jgi:DNA-binding MarR family transcriptional regulator
MFSVVRQKEFVPYGITPPQGFILFILANIHHKVTLAELAKHSKREINSISLQMSIMEKDGLVKKTRVRPKSTLLNFELTEKGLDIYEKISKMEADLTIMSILSEEERQIGISLMNKIMENAEKYIIKAIDDVEYQ